MQTRINIMMPDALLRRSHELIEDGFFSNFSEMVRECLRKEIREYEQARSLSAEERKLFVLLKKAHIKGKLLTEEQMKQHGLDIKIH